MRSEKMLKEAEETLDKAIDEHETQLAEDRADQRCFGYPVESDASPT